MRPDTSSFRDLVPRLATVALLLLLAHLCASIAAPNTEDNLSGTWEAFVRKTPDAVPFRMDFEFDADEEVLTGTVRVGKHLPTAGILDGRITPGRLSFRLLREDGDDGEKSHSVKYRGKVEGGIIHFTEQSDLGEPPLKFNARRVSKRDAKPALSIAPPVLRFDEQEVCAPSNPLPVTIVNQSDQEVSFFTRSSGGDSQFLDAECLKNKDRKPGERCTDATPKIEGRLKPGERLQASLLYWPVDPADRHRFALRVKESLLGEEYDIELLGNSVAEGGCCYYGKVFRMHHNSCENIKGIFDQNPEVAKVRCEGFEGKVPKSWVNRECPPIP